jgi:multiple sugar transport system permease protein
MSTPGIILSRRQALGFLSPAFLVIGVFLIFPALWVLYLGLTNLELTGLRAVMPQFVGLRNFSRVFQDSFFYNALQLSLAIVLGSGIIGQAGLGLFLALLMYRERSSIKSFVAACAVAAWIIPEVVVAYLWVAFLDNDFGLLNRGLALLGLGPKNWLFQYPLFSIILFNTWRGAAFSMLLFSAALETIPPSFIETADTLGASAWRRFCDIILPLLKTTILTDILLITLWTFNVFTPFLLTAGGPSFRSEILPIYVYRTSFKYFKLGYGSAISAVLLFINLAFALVYLQAKSRQKKW